MPLGDLWLGVCMADTGTPFRPDGQTLSEACNMGYARGRCPRFKLDAHLECQARAYIASYLRRKPAAA